MEFVEKLRAAIRKNRSILCVGLDPDLDKIPRRFKAKNRPLFEFGIHVVKSTADLVCAYKPNSAFYESTGRTRELHDTVKWVRRNYPLIPIILDAKRGDIGNTARHYARYCFDYQQADAATVNPYMGFDSVEPFLAYKSRGLFVLCLTSNPGARDFQQQRISGGAKLYEKVAAQVQKWGKINPGAGLVVGATKPSELNRLRAKFPALPFLIPGIGAQAGDVRGAVRSGTKNNAICVFNVSRSVLFPGRPKTIRAEARQKRDLINSFLPASHTFFTKG